MNLSGSRMDSSDSRGRACVASCPMLEVTHSAYPGLASTKSASAPNIASNFDMAKSISCA